MIKNLKVNTKKVAALTGLTVALALLPGCGKKGSDESLLHLTSEVKDSTFFDEVVEEDIIKEIDKIDEYIDLSEKIHKMNFCRNYLLDDNDVLLTVTDLKILMSYYDNKKDFSSDELYFIERRLAKQEELVNQYIYNSYDIVGTVATRGLKAKILDVKEEEKNLANFNRIIIQNVITSNYNNDDTGTLKIEMYEADRNSDLGNLLESVYQMQERGINPDKDTLPSDYNYDRNKMIKEAIYRLKTVLNYEYKENLFHKLVRKKHV